MHASAAGAASELYTTDASGFAEVGTGRVCDSSAEIAVECDDCGDLVKCQALCNANPTCAYITYFEGFLTRDGQYTHAEQVEREAEQLEAQAGCRLFSACANITQAAGGVVFKREPRIPAPDSWCMTAAGGAEQCLCTARGGNVPTGDNISLADTMCQFPFTHENVTYTDCIPLGRSHPWCYTDEATGTWGFCTAGCPLACWGLPDEGHPAPFGTYRCQFPFVDDGGDEHYTCALDDSHWDGKAPWCRPVGDLIGSIACSPTCEWAVVD